MKQIYQSGRKFDSCNGIIKSLKVNIQCKEDKSKRLSSEIERLGAEKLRIMVYIKCASATVICYLVL